MARMALVGLAFGAREGGLDRWGADFAWALADSAARRLAVDASISWAREQGADALVFSGYTQAGNVDEPDNAPIMAELRRAGISGVFELVERGAGKSSVFNGKKGSCRRAYFAFDVAKDTLSGPFYQRYSRSSEASLGQVRSLTHDLAVGGSRRLVLAEMDSALLICGEDNVLYRPRGGQVQSRWPRSAPVPRDYRMMLNPRHTVSRRQELRDRVAHLSAASGHQIAAAHANFGPGERHRAHLVYVARGGAVEVAGGSDPLVHHVNDFYGVLVDVPRAVRETPNGATKRRLS